MSRGRPRRAGCPAVRRARARTPPRRRPPRSTWTGAAALPQLTEAPPAGGSRIPWPAPRRGGWPGTFNSRQDSATPFGFRMGFWVHVGGRQRPFRG
eukprot:4676948-Prymnesium_polylepis.1